MNAIAVNPGRKEVGQVSHPQPCLGRGNEVKFRMLEVGICGTDREICRFDYGAPPNGFEHLVLGHEGLGEVTEVGDAVTTLRQGDLVVPMVRRPCADPACQPCRAERSDFCMTGNFTERGIKEMHGFMTEEVVDEEPYLCKVPDSLRDVAVMMEPLSVAEKALEQLWKVQSRLPWLTPEAAAQRSGVGKRAVILGAGPIGILGAMAFKVAGFDTYVYSRSKKPNPKAEIVESFGVPYISALETGPEQLAERIGNIDVVYEAIGTATNSFDVLSVLGQNGIFLFTGIPGFPKPHLTFDAELIMRNMVLKNQVAVGTVNASREAFDWAIRDMVEFMQRWPDAVRALITGRFPLGHARELLLGKATGIKNVLQIA
jgi:glucose 1-dehydrogenase